MIKIILLAIVGGIALLVLTVKTIINVFKGIRNFIITRISRIAAQTVRNAVIDIGEIKYKDVTEREKLAGSLYDYQKGYKSIIEEKK